jgi:hypothetical protein
MAVDLKHRVGVTFRKIAGVFDLVFHIPTGSAPSRSPGGSPPRTAVLLNAIEYMVEQGKAHPQVLRCLCDALVALAQVHGLKPSTADKVALLTRGLQKHVSSIARR